MLVLIFCILCLQWLNLFKKLNALSLCMMTLFSLSLYDVKDRGKLLTL